MLTGRQADSTSSFPRGMPGLTQGVGYFRHPRVYFRKAPLGANSGKLVYEEVANARHHSRIPAMEILTARATRRSTRLRVEIPVAVTSLDRVHPFSEKCVALVVSAQGCGFRSSRALPIETPVLLGELPGGGSASGRVASCLPLGGEAKAFLIGVALFNHGNVWGNRPSSRGLGLRRCQNRCRESYERRRDRSRQKQLALQHVLRPRRSPSQGKVEFSFLRRPNPNAPGHTLFSPRSFVTSCSFCPSAILPQACPEPRNRWSQRCRRPECKPSSHGRSGSSCAGRFWLLYFCPTGARCGPRFTSFRPAAA